VLRTNLSTRPFYNERAVYWGLGLALVAILALTAFNVTRILALSQQQSALATAADRDEERARALTSDAQRVRAGIDQDALEHVIHAAQEANEIIDARTFSWTELLNHIERTLPIGVMLTSVTPKTDKGHFRVQLVVVGKQVESVDEFIDKLEATHAFSGMSPSTERIMENGLYEVAITGDYQPSAAVAAEKPDGKPEEKPDEKSEPTSEQPKSEAKPDEKPTPPAGPTSTSPGAPSTAAKPAAHAKPGTPARGVS
jgi:hypothetical protein